jgi:hypothetical protein
MNSILSIRAKLYREGYLQGLARTSIAGTMAVDASWGSQTLHVYEPKGAAAVSERCHLIVEL